VSTGISKTFVDQHGPLSTLMLIYPGLTMFDLTGPHGHVHLAWKSPEPVATVTDNSRLPTTNFADCPVAPGTPGKAGPEVTAITLCWLQRMHARRAEPGYTAAREHVGA
jgi:hypothetical protein